VLIVIRERTTNKNRLHLRKKKTKGKIVKEDGRVRRFSSTSAKRKKRTNGPSNKSTTEPKEDYGKKKRRLRLETWGNRKSGKRSDVPQQLIGDTGGRK